jgi:transcriptional regulator with GAF, ATPase, and Fis domain
MRRNSAGGNTADGRGRWTQVNNNREQQLAQTFVELADTLVDDFDAMDFLAGLVERCVELLGVSAAGVVLSDQKNGLAMAAASSEQARLVELFVAQSTDGPCWDCVRTGQPVLSPDLAEQAARWPRFVPAALAAGFHATYALPMRLRRTVIGVLNLLDEQRKALDDTQLALGQALADVATIGLLQQRAIHHGDVLAEQLQIALNSRVVIEQAKGVLAASGGVDMEHAFTILRGYARAHNMHLTELARAIAEGAIAPDAIHAEAREPARRPLHQQHQQRRAGPDRGTV